MKKLIFLVFLLGFSGHLNHAIANSSLWTLAGATDANAQIGEVWGNIEFYTNAGVRLENGQHFRFSKNVLIDVENLKSDIRGNVRILLNADGNAKAIFFNGIDMPDAVRRFKR